jgi:hypothetical protein
MTASRPPETLSYTPDDDIRVHEEGAIRLLCKAFQSHEAGLPEWAKNGADEYARLNRPEAARVIVIIINQPSGGRHSSISCLDFGGITSAKIESDFRVWADPDASRRGRMAADIQGGHGNGGKCYMTQMFEQHAVLETVKNGRGCRYGVAGGSIRFGYIPDRRSGREYPVPDLRGALRESLGRLHVDIDALDALIQPALREADGYTLLTGVGAKGYARRIPISQLIEALIAHPQMIRTLELCRVHVVIDGMPFDGGRALSLPDITPMPGAEEPRVIAIPDMLTDPISGESVSTRSGDSLGSGCLTLRTSDVSMRWNKKFRHNIIFYSRSGFIGALPMTDVDAQSTYRDRIYGRCDLDALEEFKQNDRGRLADAPLSRAVTSWIGEQVQRYCSEFEQRERRRHDQAEKDELARMNEALDRWKNQFLNEVMRGIWGTGGDNGATRPYPPPLPSGLPARVELHMSAHRAGVGVSLKPRLRFFNAAGAQVRAVPYRWVSEDTNVAFVDEDLNIVNTFSHGTTRIYAETLDSRLTSNAADLEVVRIRRIRIEPQETQIAVGGRGKLTAICELGDGTEAQDVMVVWTENNPLIARVSAAGFVFGFGAGNTEVSAGDDHCMSRDPALVHVTSGDGGTDRRGRGYPQVKVSEIEPDPETGEDVMFSRDDPPVLQRPVDVERNIWWINSAAPLARLYLNAARGYGYNSREWRIYHLERYVDIMAQIALTHGPEQGEELAVGDWILRWGEHVADIQAAAAESLGSFIDSGILPT